MAAPSTLYRFKIELSDVDRGVYTSLDFRVAQHPSESLIYLLTRTLAFSLSFEEGLEFSPGGLSDPEAPGLIVKNPHGCFNLWIEIGNPSPRKLHKATKASNKVQVYTYKRPETLFHEIVVEKVHRGDEIEIFSFPLEFLEGLSGHLKKENRWNLVRTDSSLVVGIGDSCEHGECKRHSLPSV